MTTQAFDKSIRYDRETRDYAMYLDGELVGFARTYHEAEVTLDELVYTLLTHPQAASWSTEEPPPDDVPEEVPFGPLDDVPESTCQNCRGIHATQRCPEIRQALFAADAPATPPAWTDITLGKELCRMRWVNFKAFVALLLSVPAEHLIIYARSYQAFIRSYAPDSDMTITQVLQVWTREMGGEPSPAIRLAA